jgi:RNA polymerase sigma-70 factor (ECF subfamily)
MRDRASADAAGFDAFFRSSSHRILTQAYLLTGSSVVAQDLTQEAFLRTWIHWPRISKFENPEAWALRVLHNLSVSKARSDKHRLTPIGTFEAIQPAIEDHLVLAAALRSLPRDQARALVLHDGAGMQIRDVAREMGVPEGTVKSWVSRGRTAAAKIMSEPVQTRRKGHANR